MFTALTGKRGLACMIDSEITRDVCACRVIRLTGNEPALKVTPAYIIGEDQDSGAGL